MRDHDCAMVGCEETKATIAMYVFVAGGSYPLWVCTPEHGDAVKRAGKENGANVVFIKGGQDS